MKTTSKLALRCRDLAEEVYYLKIHLRDYRRDLEEKRARLIEHEARIEFKKNELRTIMAQLDQYIEDGDHADESHILRLLDTVISR